MKNIVRISSVLLAVVFLGAACLFAALGGGVVGCGDGISTYTTTSVVLRDATDGEVESSGTVVNDPSSLTIIFEEAMDPDAATAEGNIALTCGGLSAAIAVSLAADDADNGITGDKYTIAVADAYKYQLMECTLYVSSALVGGDGLTYTFATPCAVSDDFNADSQSCWTPEGGGFDDISTWNAWPDILANSLAFDTDDSILDYDDLRNELAADRTFLFTKDVTVSEDGFVMTMHFKSVSGITGNNDWVRAFVGMPALISSVFDLYFIGVDASPVTGQGCSVISTAGHTITGQSWSSCTGGEAYVRLTYAADSVSAETSSDGTNWRDMGTALGPGVQAIENFSGGAVFGLTFAARNGTHDNAATIDSITVSGMTADGQY